MPTSKYRCGTSFLKTESPVPPGMAAVMAVRRGSCSGEAHQGVGKHLGIGRGGGGLGFAGLRLVRAEAVEFPGIVDRRFVAASLFREDVQQHRLLLGLEKLEHPDQRRRSCPSIGP